MQSTPRVASTRRSAPRRALGRASAVVRPRADVDGERRQPRSGSPKTDEGPGENFLARYFKEMSELDVLKPEQEFESARQIETIEVALWTHLLAYAPMTEMFTVLAQTELEEDLPALQTLRRAVRRLRATSGAAARRRFSLLAASTAQALHASDVDRRALLLCIAELGKIARGDAERRYGARLHVNRQSKVFREYVREARRGFGRAQRARNDFVKANLRLVVSIARRFNHGRMPLPDLIQEGNIGLIKAVERYDYRRGYRFSTYASWWIRHSISRALADKGRAVRLPVHMIDAYHKVTRTRRELSSKLGRQPTAEEVSHVAGIQSDKVERLEGSLMEQPMSLDREVGDGEGRRYIDYMFDPEADLPSDRVIHEAVSRQVKTAFERDLKPIEADILRKRFGLAGDRELTLKEIGQTYNLSRERIRQLQEQALGKIREAIEREDAL